MSGISTPGLMRTELAPAGTVVQAGSAEFDTTVCHKRLAGAGRGAHADTLVARAKNSETQRSVHPPEDAESGRVGRIAPSVDATVHRPTDRYRGSTRTVNANFSGCPTRPTRPRSRENAPGNPGRSGPNAGDTQRRQSPRRSLPHNARRNRADLRRRGSAAVVQRTVREPEDATSPTVSARRPLPRRRSSVPCTPKPSSA